MTPETELRLSCYQELGDVDRRHGVKLVRHRQTEESLVLKKVKIYDLRVYRYLYAHPMDGVPRIRELIEDREEGALYVVEEYIPGETLRSVLDRRGTVGEEEAFGLIIQLCRILAPLHRLDPPIVHRDIKPGNLILTGGGKLVLVDFNSAKASSADRGRDTVLIGTQGYAAPEQYGFSASRPTTDIYALGVLLNELLTGAMPNRARCGGRAGEIAGRCLQMDPARRYRSVEELQAALEAEPSRPAPRPDRQEPPAWRSWLLPGFRAGNPVYMVCSGLWYALVLWMGCNLEMEGYSNSSIYTIGVRIALFSSLMFGTLWGGNYRNMWRWMPLSSSKNPLIRFVGAVLWTFVLSMGILIAGILISSILFEAV